MRKHCIENICWLEVSWQRPFNIEDVWEALTHLSALSPRGAVIWECRGKNGRVTHLLGADRMFIGKIAQVLRAHGDIQFREVYGNSRTSIRLARQLKITRPVLLLNTNLAQSVIRAGLAAMTEDKRGTETTGLAAKRNGRHYIGVEINPAFCKLAAERIAAEGLRRSNGAWQEDSAKVSASADKAAQNAPKSPKKAKKEEA